MDAVFDSAWSIVMDVLRTASWMAQRRHGTEVYSVLSASIDGGSQSTALGQVITVQAALPDLGADVVVVPGFWATTEDEVGQRLDAPDIDPVGEHLRRLHQAGSVVAAGCTGTFVVANSGLLDGRTATTTWWLAQLFRRRYPRVVLDVDRMVTRSDGLVCSGAAMAHMDLALALVDDLAGPGAADEVGRLLLLEGRASQAKYMASEQLASNDPTVLAAERYVRANLAKGFGIDDLARHVGLSRRSLARRFHDAAGVSPLAFVQRIRVERAVHLLETTDLSIEAVAEAVGHNGVAAFRRIFRRETGRAPSAYRQRRPVA